MLNDLLTDIHRSIDRLAEDLARDRPELALALRKEASLIPRPEAPPAEAQPVRTRPPELRLLLYRALDEGVVKPRHFDRLMIRRARAAQTIKARQSG